MKKLSFMLAIFIFFVSGCMTVSGPAKKLQVSDNFEPKKVYNVSYDKAWNSILSYFKKEEIMLNSVNKENGILITDYYDGWTVDTAAISTVNYRYKYQVSIDRVTKNQTRVDIKTKLEMKEMLKGGSGREAVEQLKQYEDVSSKEDNQKYIKFLQYWLYEQLEKSLK